MKRKTKSYRHHSKIAVPDIGPKIHALRKRHGIRQADLAKQVGISPGGLTNLEKGRRNVSLDWLMKIAKALDVKPSAFLDRLDLPKRTPNPRERHLVERYRKLTHKRQDAILALIEMATGR